MSIILQTLSINNLKTASGTFINLNTIRKFINYSLKKGCCKSKAVYTLTVFQILLFEGRLVLSPAQWITGTKSVQRFLKTMFELMLTKMTRTYPFQVNDLNPFRVEVKNTAFRKMYELKTSYKTFVLIKPFLKIFKLLNVELSSSTLFHWIIAKGKKSILKEVIFYFENREKSSAFLGL